MITRETKQQVALAIEAVKAKKAEDISLLELPSESSAFTDYFLICSGSNPRQVQAIADEVDERLSKQMHQEPAHREGYQNAEWVLLDYVNFVVHIFSSNSRRFYDLERLWKSAKQVSEDELMAAEKKPAAKKAAKKVAPKKAAKKVVAKKAAKKTVGKHAPAKKPGVKKAAKKKSVRK
jgi:ribosome-associated protein